VPLIAFGPVLALIRALYATSGPPPREVRALQDAVERAAARTLDGNAVALPLPLPREVFELLMRMSPRRRTGSSLRCCATGAQILVVRGWKKAPGVR
jgi:hypothetical protein